MRKSRRKRGRPHQTVNPQLASRCRNRLGSRSIVLVGMMGAGKTTVGRRLARALDLPFHDADQEIEKAAGKTIAEIFAEDGEDVFRSGEERVIKRLLENGPQVLATGGGAYMREATRANVAERGIAVWLDGSLDVLWERVRLRSHRPLLKTENPKAVLKELLERRSPYYALADIRIQSRNVPHEVVAEEIIRAIDARLAEGEAPAPEGRKQEVPQS